MRRDRSVLALFSLALLLSAPTAGAAAASHLPARKPPASHPAPRLKSPFEEEQQMSPDRLIKRWQTAVAKASQRFGIPVSWINAVMRMESGGRTMLTQTQPMISDKGAMGIMQVLPGTYREMQGQYRLGPDPFDPDDNIRAGAAYLKWLKGKYAYPVLFAAYNAGPGQVDDFLARGTPLPAETKSYVAGIGRILDGAGGLDGTLVSLVKLTRPDGSTILIDPIAVRSIREAGPGEYAPGVRAVINMGVLKQGVVEDAATVGAAIKIRGGRI